MYLPLFFLWGRVILFITYMRGLSKYVHPNQTGWQHEPKAGSHADSERHSPSVLPQQHCLVYWDVDGRQRSTEHNLKTKRAQAARAAAATGQDPSQPTGQAHEAEQRGGRDDHELGGSRRGPELHEFLLVSP